MGPLSRCFHSMADKKRPSCTGGSPCPPVSQRGETCANSAQPCGSESRVGRVFSNSKVVPSRKRSTYVVLLAGTGANCFRKAEERAGEKATASGKAGKGSLLCRRTTGRANAAGRAAGGGNLRASRHLPAGRRTEPQLTIDRVRSSQSTAPGHGILA